MVDEDTGGIRILLVDDDGDSASAMRRLLAGRGHAVHAAGCKTEALAAAAGQEFDLLICDILLPDGSGLELMRELRDGEHPELKGIAISGLTLADDIRRSHEAGYCEHVTKPINFSDLEQTIDRVVPR